ncbi:hypothetical protein IJ095_00590 [Candidatus Saccharibacteria bacterium]|nr:hypothetical protein [Candidatus Saccharibacteria bacterium]
MEGYTYLGIIVLAGLILASFATPLATLLLLYHASLGAHVRQTTRRLASSYLSGVTLMHFLLLASTAFLVSGLSVAGTFSRTSLSVLFGILLALAVVSWAFYYKRGTTTELWLPRSLAKFLSSRAKSTSDLNEAYVLGLLVPLSELLFSLPLFLLAGDAVLHLSPVFQALGLVIFTLLSVLPLLILRLSLRSGRNVTEVQRFRLRHKAFFRIFTGSGLLVLAAYLLVFLILGESL